ncbi:MAG: 5-formyltetrahydrofolate cyclo-ligase [Silicimonas sp.]|nr:5-formyltetrahydrofolate cyclo-ligase [Silicimonas sp.]
MTDKAELRKIMATRRDAAASTADQARAQDRLREVLADGDGPVSFFWPIRSEIDTRPVMAELAATRVVCLPLTHGRGSPLTFHRWTPETRMVPDGFGVPVPEDTEEVVPATLVVPMLAFDRFGHRLGYGAGHYDRTLAKLRPMAPVLAVGFAFEAQFVETPLPSEPTDQPLDLIVTEAAIHRPDA